ncbi:MAG: hypothetical protein J6X32_10115 [Salinivirgaceae bacterium]|nr:hypothetical protein [Salinivirgaceae bacterium]
MNPNLLKTTIAVALVALNFISCKEKPSTVPTIPTTISIEDGYVTVDTNITLSVSGSTVEDDGYNISYKYYIGTSQDNLVETSPEKIKLIPYTQYFWNAKAITETDESTPTETRTFYCVPQFEIETDNGDGEWAAILRFKNVCNIKSGKVTLSPDKQGYNYQTEIEIPAGQDSCYIKMGSKNSPTNAAYTHWWDDEHGIYYEPIIYDFNVSLDIQVGNKSFSISNTAKEIILDKNSCARDHEFNVYRLVKIGNQTWMADDFRAKSIIYKGKVYSLNSSGIIRQYFIGQQDTTMPALYEVKTLKSGAQGIMYNVGVGHSNRFEIKTDGKWEEFVIYDLLKYTIPKGFHIPTFDEWAELEMYYGVEQPSITYHNSGWGTPQNCTRVDNFNWIERAFIDDFQGQDVDIRKQLSSMYDWIFYNKNEEPITIPTQFNAKPFSNEGYGCVYKVAMTEEEKEKYAVGIFVELSTVNCGIMNDGNDSPINYGFSSVRLIKD